MRKDHRAKLWQDVQNEVERQYSLKECKQILRWHNLWRRGKQMKMIPPKMVGIAIDRVAR